MQEHILWPLTVGFHEHCSSVFAQNKSEESDLFVSLALGDLLPDCTAFQPMFSTPLGNLNTVGPIYTWRHIHWHKVE